MANEVFAFEVSVIGHPDWGMTINHRTAGKAKSSYYRELGESWPNIPFTALRVRKLGKARNTRMIAHVAEYRGVSFKAGDRVKVPRGRGVIVDAGSGANFGVLYDDDSPNYAGMILYCHPTEIELEANHPDTLNAGQR